MFDGGCLPSSALSRASPVPEYPLTTVLNAGLQVVIIGLGASIGRELARREISAMIVG